MRKHYKLNPQDTPCPLWTGQLQGYFQGREDAGEEGWLSYHNYRLDFLYKRAVGKHVKNLRERNERDLARQDDEDFEYYYSHEAAQHAVDFFDKLKHSKGQWARETFELQPWQEYDIIRPLFGWLKKSDDTRRFNIFYLEVAKKNGKSTLLAGIGLYLTIADNEPGAEVYSAATKKDQARIIHGEAIRMARASTDLSKYVTTLKNNISMPTLGSKFEPVGSDSDGLDGINPSGATADEIHRWRNRDVWDVLQQSGATRREPLIAACTTAGTGRTSFCFQLRQTYVRFLDPNIPLENDKVYPYIATLDGYEEAGVKKDDPYDENNWVKANPSLHVTIRVEEMRDRAAEARLSVAQENAFLRYRCNVWTEQAVRWLPMHKWAKCTGELYKDREGYAILDQLVGQKCYGGLDMATTVDIAAFVLAFPWENEQIRLLPYFFIPEETVQERWKRDNIPYPQWVEMGLIETTPGDAISYDYIRDRIVELGSVFNIQEIAYDPFNAIHTAQQLEAEGFTMAMTRQGFLSMNAPCKIFEIKVRQGELEHADNEVLTWMASNVAVATDHSDNIRPVKDKSAEKIDGIVAAIMAVGRCALMTNNESVYEERGVIHIKQ